MSEDQKWTYTFHVWPDETANHRNAMFDLFRHCNMRCEMEFTEDQFGFFRESLGHSGITLREIERWPAVEPEIVL